MAHERRSLDIYLFSVKKIMQNADYIALDKVKTKGDFSSDTEESMMQTL